MKLLYLHRFFEKNSGIDKKIFSQVKNLSDLGLNSKIILICDNNTQPIVNEYTQIIQISTPKTGFSLINKIGREYSINNVLIETIKALQSSDILYMRIPYPSLFLSRILQTPRLCKIVIEYQTIEPLQYRLVGKYWYILIDLLFGDAIRRYSDAIVGVTDEITQYQLTRSSNPNKPHITLGNGIDTKSIPLRKVPPVLENELFLLCVANVSQWHGLDRILRGIAEYNKATSITLHIAGEESELLHLKELSRELGISEHVIFHGFVTGESLNDLFNNCHIAVGSLGIHRKGLTQTSELKAREYCARGIPYILASNDPDFPDDFPYSLRFPADESTIDMETVLAFSSRICQDVDHPQKMRQYAIWNLDWSVKMKKLKEFLKELADEENQ